MKLRVRELPASAVLGLVDAGRLPGFLPAGARVFEISCPHTARPHYRAVSLPSPEEIRKTLLDAAREAGVTAPELPPLDAEFSLPPDEHIKRSVVQSLASYMDESCGCVGRWWACHGPDYELEGCAVHGGVCAN